MAIFGLQKVSVKQSKAREKTRSEKSGNFEMDIECQPVSSRLHY